jgi:hypothetical protein
MYQSILTQFVPRKDQTDCSSVREILEHFHKVMEYEVKSDRVYAEQWRELLVLVHYA